MADILRRGARGTLGTSGGLTLIKSAAARPRFFGAKATSAPS